jgi:hypothetical protein
MIWALDQDERDGTLLRAVAGTQQQWKNNKWPLNALTVENNAKIRAQNQAALVNSICWLQARTWELTTSRLLI